MIRALSGDVMGITIEGLDNMESPLPLRELCVNYLCNNLDNVCETIDNHNAAVTELHFKSDVFLPRELSERLIAKFNEKEMITDKTLSLFSSTKARVRYLKLHSAATLSHSGLRALHGHPLQSIEMSHVRVPLSDLLDIIVQGSRNSLSRLVVPHITVAYTPAGIFANFKKLVVLDVSNSDLDRRALETIAIELPNLEVLDISGTQVDEISPLLKLRHTLQSLSIANLQARSVTTDAVLIKLERLKHLDISDESERNLLETTCKMSMKWMELPNSLPLLESLDISGQIVTIEQLTTFLEHHQKICFLGLLKTSLSELNCFVDSTHPNFNPHLIVTGTSSESQLLAALRRYMCRPILVQQCLYHLFRHSAILGIPRPDLVALVLEAMHFHPKQFSVQMAATACLYNLTKAEYGQKLNPKLLSQTVHLTLQAMENFPTNFQLQKNTLLTLCSDRILQDIQFDRFRCTRLVLNCLCSFEDPSVHRMSVAISSILAAKISTKETSLLGAEPRYMQKLLSLVRGRLKSHIVDITLKFALSALWNLTDEAPDTCTAFLQESGLDLFIEALQAFHGEPTVETKVLGLLNNIAEVQKLRKSLLLADFLSTLRTLLQSPHIDVSYFAAGILAHLASDQDTFWPTDAPSRQSLMQELHSAVLGWSSPDGEMVAYRSFQPFFPLLCCDREPQVQLWAIWAIHHVCSKNARRYCPMLISEGGDELLKSLLGKCGVSCDVAHFCVILLELLQQEKIDSCEASNL